MLGLFLEALCSSETIFVLSAAKQRYTSDYGTLHTVAVENTNPVGEI
jgi:hypothetical protein